MTTISGTVAAEHDHALATLPFDDTADFDAATRGFFGTMEPPIVRDADGRVVWDLDSYSFLEGDAPETVNPSLWRQSQLLTKHVSGIDVGLRCDALGSAEVVGVGMGVEHARHRTPGDRSGCWRRAIPRSTTSLAKPSRPACSGRSPG